MTTARPQLNDATLYWLDNGRIACGRHAGATAQFSGRTIAGQPVVALTKEDQDEMRAFIKNPADSLCESCRAGL